MALCSGIQLGLVLLAVNLAYAQKADIDSLKLVHAIWRHGDTTPSETFPTDTENGESTWPEGFGETTRKGVYQNYDLGRWLRQRYEGFISSTYSVPEIYVKTTSSNRTIVSANATMAGLYEKPGSTYLKEHIYEQPVPLHSPSKGSEEDQMLHSAVPCPNDDVYFAEAQNSERVKQLEANNADFLNMLSKNTGLNKTLKLADLEKIYDPLFCEREHNDTHRWPRWVTEDIWRKLHALYMENTDNALHHKKLQRLRGGLLLGDINERMNDEKMGKLDKSLKMYAYSGHGVGNAAFLADLGFIPPETWPTYASLILIELHAENDGTYIVEAYYKNVSQTTVTPIDIENCPKPCTLEQFRNRNVEYVFTDWKTECGIGTSWWIYLVIALALLLLLLLLLLGCMLYRKHKNRYSNPPAPGVAYSEVHTVEVRTVR